MAIKNRNLAMRRFVILMCMLVALCGCTGVAENIMPVENFELERYLGKWYEIARLDHSFERGLEKISAEYSLRDDGGVRVLNRGFSSAKNTWKEAEGRAYFVNGADKGHLKVSFFGPFYGSYVIFELDDKDYQYAFVTSYKKSYLWLLARQASVPAEVRERFLKVARDKGFDVDNLIFVQHE